MYDCATDTSICHDWSGQFTQCENFKQQYMMKIVYNNHQTRGWGWPGFTSTDHRGDNLNTCHTLVKWVYNFYAGTSSYTCIRYFDKPGPVPFSLVL